MNDSYIRGYHAGYNQAKKEISKDKAYHQGYMDALEYVKGILSVQIARENMERGGIE